MAWILQKVMKRSCVDNPPSIQMKLLQFFLSFLFFFLVFSTFSLFSQNENMEKTAIDYRIETLGSVASQPTTAFWIFNNTQGVIPLEANHALMRGHILGSHRLDRNTEIEAGIDIVGLTTGRIVDSIGTGQPHVFLQQLYVSLAYKSLKLKVGMKPVENSALDRSLSSGDFVFSPNARPIPEINLQIPNYITVPFTKEYIKFKGDFALGKFIDDSYTRAVRSTNAVYAQDVLLHHKSFFISLKDPAGKKPFNFVFGFVHCVQWGGWNLKEGHLPQSFADFFKVVVSGEGDENAPVSEQINLLGNHLGTYTVRLGYSLPAAELAVYKHHYFEDASGMEYANWPDGIWGFECSFHKQNRLEKVVFEYIQTTQQSGPFHFPFHKEFPPGMKPRIGGGDSYYNHGIYTNGWSHFGRTIGNPLITSPEYYNRDGTLGFKNNRIQAFHIGIKGNISSACSYRIIGTSMKGFGTQKRPFLKKMSGLSGLMECNYIFPKGKGWEAGIQLAIDRGTLYGNNFGGLLRVAKRGNVLF
jgi:hypothetical protein